jgi:hemerythrin
MALIDWSDEHNVNVREIDDQHRQLVALVNQLHEAMKLRGGKEAIRRRLGDLIRHTQVHFSTEERLMSDTGYPEYGRHKAEHDALLRQVVNLERQVHEGDLLLSFGVALDLRAWAIGHITFSDKPLGLFLNRHGVF